VLADNPETETEFPVPLKITCSPEPLYTVFTLGFVPFPGAVKLLLVFIITTLPSPEPLVQDKSMLPSDTFEKVMFKA